MEMVIEITRRGGPKLSFLKVIALEDIKAQVVRLTESVTIPKGTFTMGSAELGQVERQVTLTKAYRIGKFSVTSKLFRLYMEANNQEVPERLQRVFDPAYADHPVVNVTWHEAKACCEWLTSLKLINLTTGRERVFRLPTEAEWEKAARGEQGRTFAWGNEAPDPTRAVYYREGHEVDTQSVGLHPAGRTPEGAEDMIGNVWEWTADGYVEDPAGDTDPYTPPKSDTSNRVLRGCSFGHDVVELHGAVRDFSDADDWLSNNGFRFAED